MFLKNIEIIFYQHLVCFNTVTTNNTLPYGIGTPEMTLTPSQDPFKILKIPRILIKLRNVP